MVDNGHSTRLMPAATGAPAPGRGTVDLERADSFAYLRANWDVMIRHRWLICATAFLLTDSGRSQLAELGQRFGVASKPSLSAHVCSWDRVPVARIEEFARAVYRTATRLGAYSLRQRAPSAELARMLAAIGGLPAQRKSA